MTFDYILKFATFNFAIVSPQTGLWRGNLVLQDLKVRADVSRKLRLPIVLEQGCVEFLRLEVSFKCSNKLCKTFWIKTASHCRWAGHLPHNLVLIWGSLDYHWLVARGAGTTYPFLPSRLITEIQIKYEDDIHIMPKCCQVELRTVCNTAMSCAE